MISPVIVLAALWGIVLCGYDFQSRRLPNWLTMGGAAAVLAARLGFGGVPFLVDGLAAACVAGGFLLIPFLLKGAGGGDVKMLFAAGAITGWSLVIPMLWFTSLAGIVVGVALILAGRLDPSRVRHYALCAFNWRYDRRAGAASLLPRENERVRMPFSIAITIGLVAALTVG